MNDRVILATLDVALRPSGMAPVRASYVAPPLIVIVQRDGFGRRRENIGWEAGIRTPIGRSRVCSPTVGRPPSLCNYVPSPGEVCQPKIKRKKALTTRPGIVIRSIRPPSRDDSFH